LTLGDIQTLFACSLCPLSGFTGTSGCGKSLLSSRSSDLLCAMS
jgi:hypothetical protein